MPSMVDWVLRQECRWHEQLFHCRLWQCWRRCHILFDACNFRLASPPSRPVCSQGVASGFYCPIHYHCRRRHHVVDSLPRHANRKMERTPPRRPAASGRAWHHRQRCPDTRGDHCPKVSFPGIRLSKSGPRRENRIRRHWRAQG